MASETLLHARAVVGATDQRPRRGRVDGQQCEHGHEHGHPQRAPVQEGEQRKGKRHGHEPERARARQARERAHDGLERGGREQHEQCRGREGRPALAPGAQQAKRNERRCRKAQADAGHGTHEPAKRGKRGAKPLLGDLGHVRKATARHERHEPRPAGGKTQHAGERGLAHACPVPVRDTPAHGKDDHADTRERRGAHVREHEQRKRRASARKSAGAATRQKRIERAHEPGQKRQAKAPCEVSLHEQCREVGGQRKPQRTCRDRQPGALEAAPHPQPTQGARKVDEPAEDHIAADDASRKSLAGGDCIGKDRPRDAHELRAVVPQRLHERPQAALRKAVEQRLARKEVREGVRAGARGAARGHKPHDERRGTRMGEQRNRERRPHRRAGLPYLPACLAHYESSPSSASGP